MKRLLGHWYRLVLVKAIKPANNYVRWERLNSTGIYDTKRALLHAPIGVLTAWLCWCSPYLGIPFFTGFLVYQIVEDWRIKDRGYKDILGFLWGFAITAAIFACLVL